MMRPAVVVAELAFLAVVLLLLRREVAALWRGE